MTENSKQTGTVKFDQLPKEEMGSFQEHWEGKQLVNGRKAPRGT